MPGSTEQLTGDTRDLDVAAVVERAVVRLRRGMSRRQLGGRVLDRVAALGVHLTMQDLLVVDVVEEGPDEDGRGVTVGSVANRGAIDPSRASRVVASAVNAGLVRRVASQEDARRVHLELTDLGRDVAAAAHATRRVAFANVMRDWTAEECDQFALLLTRFSQAPDAEPASEWAVSSGS